MSEFDTPQNNEEVEIEDSHHSKDDNVSDTPEEVVSNVDQEDDIQPDIIEEVDATSGDDTDGEVLEDDVDLDEADEETVSVTKVKKSAITPAVNGFKLWLAHKLYDFQAMDRRKRNKMILIYSIVILLILFVWTDIIPILPNSYHRSYVGNSYTLGETQNCDAKSYGKNILYASNGTAMIFAPDMELISKMDTFPGYPNVRTKGEAAVVYCKNSDNALVMRDKDNFKIVTADEAIISASVNHSGDYILVTVESGYTACLSAYTKEHKSVYKWHTNSNITDTAISDDGNVLVAATLVHSKSEVYSKLIFLDISSKTPVEEIELSGNVISELSFEDGTLVCIGDAYSVAYTASGHEKWKIDYEGKLLKTFDISDDGNIVFLFNRYNSELSESRIELYSVSGRRTGYYDSEDNVRSISANNDYCLLSSDNKTIAIDDDGDVREVKTHEKEYQKLILFHNYNFAFGVSDSIAETVSVLH